MVQIGSNSTTLTPNLPDELVNAFSTGDRSTIAAILAETGPPFDSSVAYGASKTAITRWCRRHATTDDWVGAGIRLNVIAPGAVQTPLLQGGDDDPTFGPLTSGLPVPTGRGEPADIASWTLIPPPPASLARWSSSMVGATPWFARTIGPAPSRCDHVRSRRPA